MSGPIRLEPVTPENWRTWLEVSEEQRAWVADRTTLLARAYAYRSLRSEAFFLLHGQTPVGMALYYDSPELAAYIFSQLFIDARWQRRGFGRAAACALLERMAADGQYDRVLLCYVDGDEAARRLYASLGFVPTGEQDEDEIMMEKCLR